MVSQYLSPRDECGDGNGSAVRYDDERHWQSFPVFFSIDVIGEYTFAINTPEEVQNAVMNCFLYVNELLGFEFFRYTSDDSKAKVKFVFLPREGSVTATCSSNFSRETKKMNRSTIMLDNTDRKWFVNPKVQCNQSGSYYDIADVLTHEIGHAIGLAHNTGDSKATMNQGGGKGRNIRRTYSKGERELIAKIYARFVTQSPSPQPAPAPVPTPSPIVIQKPSEGIILHGGWGASKDVNVWRIVSMKDRPQLFKVVDDKGVNVATDFSSKTIAQQYIDYYKATS